jgi:hypothetical protein
MVVNPARSNATPALPYRNRAGTPRVGDSARVPLAPEQEAPTKPRVFANRLPIHRPLLSMTLRPGVPQPLGLSLVTDNPQPITRNRCGRQELIRENGASGMSDIQGKAAREQ